MERMNVINEEISAIQTNIAVLKKIYKEHNDERIKQQIIQLESELESRLEKIL